MKFRNICPNGPRWIPDLHREVAAGGVVDVPDEFGAGMLGQVDVWELVDEPKPKKAAKNDDQEVSIDG